LPEGFAALAFVGFGNIKGEIGAIQ
jgi:hypothetical protein